MVCCMIDIRPQLLDTFASSPLKMRADWVKRRQRRPNGPSSRSGKGPKMLRQARTIGKSEPQPSGPGSLGGIQSP
jgi:hypothetical protein